MLKTLFLRISQLFCIFSFVLLLWKSDIVSFYARQGIALWATSILPLLLPFIILSKLWLHYDVPTLFFSFCKKLFPRRISIAVSLPILLLGLSSGFPVGAVFVRYFYERHFLTKKEAENLLPLCSFVSPMFLFGYIKSTMQLPEKTFLFFLFSQYLPIFFFYLKETVPQSQTKSSKSSLQRNGLDYKKTSFCPSPPSTLQEIFHTSFEIIVTIGIYMMLFSILFGLVSRGWNPPNPLVDFFLSNLEITTAIGYLSKVTTFSAPAKRILLAQVTAFGGCCTMAQVSAIVQGSHLSMHSYFFMKLKLMVLSAIFFGIPQGILHLP